MALESSLKVIIHQFRELAQRSSILSLRDAPDKLGERRTIRHIFNKDLTVFLCHCSHTDGTYSVALAVIEILQFQFKPTKIKFDIRLTKLKTPGLKVIGQILRLHY